MPIMEVTSPAGARDMALAKFLNALTDILEMVKPFIKKELEANGMKANPNR